MKEQVMAMKVGDVLGCRVKYRTDWGTARTGTVQSISQRCLKVRNYHRNTETVKFYDVLEVVDAKNQS